MFRHEWQLAHATQAARPLRRIAIVDEALAMGLVAWLPLLAWNVDNGEAGLKFQLVDRHPWSFQPNGIWFVLIQGLLVTP